MRTNWQANFQQRIYARFVMDRLRQQEAKKRIKKAARDQARGYAGESLEPRVMLASDAHLSFTGAQGVDSVVELMLSFDVGSQEFLLKQDSVTVDSIKESSLTSVPGTTGLSIQSSSSQDILRLDLTSLAEFENLTIHLVNSEENVSGGEASVATNDRIVIEHDGDFEFDGTVLTASAGSNTLKYTLNGFDGIDLLGSEDANEFVFSEPAESITMPHVTILGRGGVDTVRTASLGNQWLIGKEEASEDENSVVISNAGTLNEVIEFRDIENVAGSQGVDAFLFLDGASISGVVDGGGGEDGLDYGRYSTPVFFDAALSTATGTGSVQNITSVTGSGNAADQLLGPAANVTWIINGENSGQIELSESLSSIRFSQFKNLFGSDGGSDDFLFESGGIFDGAVYGGNGSGVDGLVVESDSDPGVFSLVHSAGSQEQTVSEGTFMLADGTSRGAITFTGIEPLVSVDGNTTMISGSSQADNFFIDYSFDATTSESLSLANVGNNFYDAANNVFMPSLPLPVSENLHVSLGSGYDSLDLTFFDTSVNSKSFRVVYDGGLGVDRLKGFNQETIWNVTNVDAGNLSSSSELGQPSVLFENIESLQGGEENDTFRIYGEADITSEIIGGGGNNTLDYSNASSRQRVVVDGYLSGITHFIGSELSDTLVVSNSDNFWEIDGENKGSIDRFSSVTVPFANATVSETVTREPSPEVLALRSEHGLFTGDRVKYDAGLDGQNDASGLIDGHEYFVIRDVADRLRLTQESPSEVEFTGVELSEGTRSFVWGDGLVQSFGADEKLNAFDNILEFSSAHSLEDGLEVTYKFTGELGAEDNSGLLSGSRYTVVVLGETQVRLLITPVSQVVLSDAWTWGSDSNAQLVVQKQFETITFESFENLLGSGSNDSFTLAGEGRVDGTIDGGGGNNILDLSTISSRVTVDLADVPAGLTTGAAGVLNINEVKGGSGFSDVLHGPDASDVIWDITGKNSGTVGTVVFSGFENLQGADNVNDGFLLNVDGEITGSVDGGGGSGIDGLAIQDPDDLNAPPTL